MMAKRIFDLVLGGAAIAVLAPVMLGVALLIRLRLGSPILFRQVRPGYKARPFVCLKFRTMTDKRDGDGRLLPDRERLSRMGRWLRSTSLDELPELINVLRGEMSLVGPRPLLTQYLGRYSAEQMRRHEVKPGLTGWAQINGRNALDWEQKFEMDIWYVDHRGLWLDFCILARTAWQVARRTNVSKPGYVSMPEFMGSYAKPEQGSRR